MRGSETVCAAASAAASYQERKARVSGIFHIGCGGCECRMTAAGRSGLLIGIMRDQGHRRIVGSG